MAAKFFSNNIPLKPKSFAEFAQETVSKMRKEAEAQGQIKTASATEEVKTAKKELPAFIQEKKKNPFEKKDDDKGDKECSASTKVAKKEKDEAETSGQLKVEPLHQDGESNKGSDITGKNKKVEASGSNSDDKAETSGQLKVEPLHQTGESTGKETKKEEKKEDKEANSTTHVVKLAKLDSKTREFLKSYWGNLYPPDYVEAMLQEK